MPVAVANTVAKLLARDDRTVAAAREHGSVRQRARREQLADVSLRSSIMFVLETTLR